MRINENSFTLTKADLKALLAFACQDAFRKNIACVRFEPRNGSAIASDGYTLVKATSHGRYDAEPFSVPAKTLKGTMSGTGRNAECSVRSDGDTAIVDWPGSVSTIPVDPSLKFPPYDQVIPGNNRSSHDKFVGFNPAYLARLVLVRKAARPGGQGAARFEIGCGGSLDPARCDIPGKEDCDWTVVIAPMRV